MTCMMRCRRSGGRSCNSPPGMQSSSVGRAVKCRCARSVRAVLDRIVRQVVCEGGGGARTASVADREIGTMCWLMPIHPRRLCWLLLAASAGRRPSWRRR